MTDIKLICLDSSAWLSYFFQESFEVKGIIEGEDVLMTSSISLFEVKKRLLILKKDPEHALKLIKQRSNILVPGFIIAETAADLSLKHHLAAVDALIYASCRLSGAELITGDNDFRGLEKVRIIS